LLSASTDSPTTQNTLTFLVDQWCVWAPVAPERFRHPICSCPLPQRIRTPTVQFWPGLFGARNRVLRRHRIWFLTGPLRYWSTVQRCYPLHSNAHCWRPTSDAERSPADCLATTVRLVDFKTSFSDFVNLSYIQSIGSFCLGVQGTNGTTGFYTDQLIEHRKWLPSDWWITTGW